MARNVLFNIVLVSAVLFLNVSLGANIESSAAIEFKFAHQKPLAKDDVELFAQSSRERLFVEPNPVFSSVYFSNCDFTWSKENGWMFSAAVTSVGKKKFNDLTKQNIGKRLGVLTSGVLWNAPVIKQAIDLERGITIPFQGMDKQQMQALSQRLSGRCRK